MLNRKSKRGQINIFSFKVVTTKKTVVLGIEICLRYLPSLSLKPKNEQLCKKIQNSKIEIFIFNKQNFIIGVLLLIGKVAIGGRPTHKIKFFGYGVNKLLSIIYAFKKLSLAGVKKRENISYPTPQKFSFRNALQF